jgi:cyclopropane-fatty-acyl-phospholipid synthase
MMKEDQLSPSSRAKSITLQLLDELLSAEATQEVGVRLWDGTLWPDDQPRPARLVLNHSGALRAMFTSTNEVGLAEAYLYDDFDIEGDIESVYGLANGLIKASSSLSTKVRIARMLLRLPAGDDHQQDQRGPAELSEQPHSIDRDRQAVTYHYDVSNDFYALWLDRNLVYTCAYFDSPEEDLDSAQVRKLEYICRKLRLRPSQRLLDIGCGWGGFVRHAAEKYGADATGITLSRPQVELANQRLAEAGLADRARVEELDYREIEEDEGYDALVSVGMFEHVGAALLATYFQKAMRILHPGGVFLNHGIASNATIQPRRGPTFTQRYVFPDGELIPINVSLRAAEEAGFEVRDVESLREHYALTLRHWVRRLEDHHQRALKFVSEPTYRVWRLFMSASAYGFSAGSINVYQSLLVKPQGEGASDLPLTRADWYA